jgi:hypothetical protein
MHLDQEQIERMIHGEADAGTREHVARCEECRMRMADALALESEVFDLLAHLDKPPRHASAATIMERARRSQRPPLRWAAGVVLALGLAGAALAVPGSPVRAWLRIGKSVTNAAPPATDAGARDAATGIAVPPGSVLTIQFQNPQQTGVARVRLVEAGDVVIRSLAGRATFTSGATRVAIANTGSGDFEIDIPRAAARVVIVLGGRQLLLKDGATITSSGPTDASGAYLLDMKGETQ